MPFPSRCPSKIAAALTVAVALGLVTRTRGAELSAHQHLGREILRELVEIDTTHEHGATTPAAEAVARRLLDAGVPPSDIQVLGPAASRNHNVVARLRGTGPRRPILLLAHLDVVEARPEDWSLAPFKLNEKDGFFYGRGTYDVKDGAAILAATIIRLRQEGFEPDRDLILALTAGEEAGSDYNGMKWLLEEHRDLVDAEYCINMDSGDPQIKGGRRIARTVQASEKVVQTFRLEVTNPGGHSSLPLKDNAIYRLAAALQRLAAYEFPARSNEVTRAYFDGLAATTPDAAVAADLKAASRPHAAAAAVARLSTSAFYNAQLRTTCVATQIEGGHAENALPQRARATVNCRMLPDEVPSQVEVTLRRLIADDQVRISVISPALSGPASPLAPTVMEAVERTTARLWPGVPVIPVMETGATDGKYLRNAGIPTYGISGVFIDIDDIRAHGRDERISVRDYYDGLEYIYQLVHAVARP